MLQLMQVINRPGATVRDRLVPQWLSHWLIDEVNWQDDQDKTV